MDEVNSILSWASEQPTLTHLALRQHKGRDREPLTSEILDALPAHITSLDLSGHAVSTEVLEALLSQHARIRALTLGLPPKDITWIEQATERGLFDALDTLDLTIEHIDMDAPARIIPAMRRRPLTWFALRSELLDREARAFAQAYDRVTFVHGLEAPRFSCWHACQG